MYNEIYNLILKDLKKMNHSIDFDLNYVKNINIDDINNTFDLKEKEQKYSIFIWYELDNIDQWYESYIKIYNNIIKINKTNNIKIGYNIIKENSEFDESNDIDSLISFFIIKALMTENHLEIIKYVKENFLFNKNQSNTADDVDDVDIDIDADIDADDANDNLINRKYSISKKNDSNQSHVYWKSSIDLINKCVLWSINFFIFIKYYNNELDEFDNYGMLINLLKKPTDEDFKYLIEKITMDSLKNDLKSKLKEFFSCIFALLKSDKVILSKKINIEHKTIIHYSLKKSINKRFYDYGYSFIKFNQIKYINDYFWISQHYSKIFPIFKPNEKSNLIINIFNVKDIEKISNGFFYNSRDDLIEIIKLIEQHKKIDFNQLNSIITRDVNDLYYFKKKLSEKKSIKDFSENSRKEYKEITSYIDDLISDLSKKWVFNNLNRLTIDPFIFDRKIYVSCTLEWRGRIYFNSPIGFTSSIYPRFFANEGCYTQFDLDEYNNLNLLDDTISEFDSMIIDILSLKEIVINKITKHITFWCALSIGNIILEKKEITTVKEYIEASLNFIIDGSLDRFNLKDKIALWHYNRIIENLKNYPHIKKYYIQKDHTASVWQNIVRICGPLNEKSLEITNLKNNNSHCDTYIAMYNHYLEKYENTFQTYINKKENITYTFVLTPSTDIRKRSCIKPISMLVVYGASFITCLEKIEKTLNRKVNQNERLCLIHYYNYLKKEVDKDLFISEKFSDILEKHHLYELYNHNQIMVISEESAVNMIYRTIEKCRSERILIDSNNKRIRHTYVHFFLTHDRYDYIKSKKTMSVHIPHICEGVNIRQFLRLSKHHVFTIHDCYLSTPLECSINVINVNKVMNMSPFLSKYKSHPSKTNYWSITVII